jgi:hypothetical protein
MSMEKEVHNPGSFTSFAESGPYPTEQEAIQAYSQQLAGYKESVDPEFTRKIQLEQQECRTDT